MSSSPIRDDQDDQKHHQEGQIHTDQPTPITEQLLGLFSEPQLLNELSHRDYAPLRAGEDQPMWSIFLSNLDPTLTDEELNEFMRGQPGGESIFTSHVVMDRETGVSKGYGFVHYTDNSAYRKALDECERVEIKGRLAKCAPAEDKKKVYVRNLPKDLSEDRVKDEITKIAGNYEAINIRGDYCFVTYVNFAMAERALKKLNEGEIAGSKLHAEPAKAQKTRDESSSFANTSLHIRNIAPETTEQSLEDHFASVGKIREVRVPKDRVTNTNAGFAFVEFESAESATKGIQLMNHSTLDGKTIEVSFSKNKSGGAGRRDDDRRGGAGGRTGGYGGMADPYRGMGGAPMMMGAYPPYGAYPGAGGRGGAAPFPYYMPYPYGAAAPTTGGRSGRETSTAFPAYGMPPGAGGYPYMDPRYMQAYGMMAAGMGAGAGAGAVAGMGATASTGFSAKKDSKRRSRSRSRSPKRRDRSVSKSRSRSRSRDRKRR